MKSFLIFFVLSFLSNKAFSFSDNKAEIIQNPGCGEGSQIYFQKKGPFALFISCEDALGKYATVVFYGRMGAPSSEKWFINQRFWTDESWGVGVRDFAWIDRDKLIITTSAVSSSPKVYLLSLLQKTFKVIYSAKEEHDLSIQGFNGDYVSVADEYEKKIFVHKIQI